eukprot:185001_1
MANDLIENVYDFSDITSVPKTILGNNIKEMFSKYMQIKQSVEISPITNWTGFDVVMSLIDYLVNKASEYYKTSHASWQFVEYFRRYCRDMIYDGSTFYWDSKKLTQGSVCISKVNAQYGTVFHGFTQMFNNWFTSL